MSKYVAGIASGLVVLWLLFSIVYMVATTEPPVTKFSEGVVAREKGVPANANPYIGYRAFAKEWLDGWMSKTEAK